jgi:hypothetical protein
MLKLRIGSVAFVAAMACPHLAAESITWEATAIGPKGPIAMAKGTKAYSPAKDIVVQDSGEKDGAPSWIKSLALDDNFGIGAAIHMEQPLTGFGLMVFHRGDSDGFSWEWFEKVGGATFERLQGSGRVAVQIEKQGKSEELVSVEFLEDVTLRYLDDMSKAPGTVTHELLIRKGSILALRPRNGMKLTKPDAL